MNVHKNARLTPRGRERIVRQVASGQTPRRCYFGFGRMGPASRHCLPPRSRVDVRCRYPSNEIMLNVRAS